MGSEVETTSGGFPSLFAHAQEALTVEVVLRETGARSLTDVIALNVWGRGLRDVGLVARLVNVRTLSLSENQVGGLAPFRSLSRLEELFLRGNNIKDLAQVAFLRGLKHLRALWLAGNPCAADKHYRTFTAALLPQLVTLDGSPITEAERRVGMAQWKDADVREMRHRAAALLRGDPQSDGPSPAPTQESGAPQAPSGGPSDDRRSQAGVVAPAGVAGGLGGPVPGSSAPGEPGDDRTTGAAHSVPGGADVVGPASASSAEDPAKGPGVQRGGHGVPRDGDGASSRSSRGSGSGGSDAGAGSGGSGGGGSGGGGSGSGGGSDSGSGAGSDSGSGSGSSPAVDDAVAAAARAAAGHAEGKAGERDLRDRDLVRQSPAEKMRVSLQGSMVRAVEELLVSLDAEHLRRVQDICATLLGPKA